KILQSDEHLPSQWPIQGTSGYDFLAITNAVLSDGSSEERLTRFYSKLTGHEQPIPPLLWQAKESQLMEAMKGELDNLFRFLQEVVLTHKIQRENDNQEALKSALAQFIIHCPVYRWYGHSFPLTDVEGGSIRKTLELAAADYPNLRKELALLEELLVPAMNKSTEPLLAHIALFYQRCMQLTGALMAKGLED